MCDKIRNYINMNTKQLNYIIWQKKKNNQGLCMKNYPGFK